MTYKTSLKKTVPPETVPTLSFSFLRVFTVAATGSIGVVAASILSILGMVGVVALVIVGKHFGLTLSGLGRIISPWLNAL